MENWGQGVRLGWREGGNLEAWAQTWVQPAWSGQGGQS